MTALVTVLADATTDHRPVLDEVVLDAEAVATTSTRTIQRRKTKDVAPSALNSALERTSDWSEIHKIGGVNDILGRLLSGVNAALDIVAPLTNINIRNGRDLYLLEDTFAIMRFRDKASGATYRRTKNRVNALVKRDKLLSNLSKLQASDGSPRVLWEIANAALGKARPTLPASVKVNGVGTTGPAAAATAVYRYYVDKVDMISTKILSSPASALASDWPPETAPFEFAFALANRITHIVRGLGSTEALGVDRIPVSIWKKGIEVLSCPIAHLVNQSLASGIVPDDFKCAVVHPVHKGSGKPRAEPSSY
jgi:hypothetical protein